MEIWIAAEASHERRGVVADTSYQSVCDAGVLRNTLKLSENTLHSRINGVKFYCESVLKKKSDLLAPMTSQQGVTMQKRRQK